MLKMFAVAVGAALVALVPGVASAQDANDGILCVYDAVSQDYETVAEAFLYGEGTDTADALLDKAAQSCSDQFKFSEDKTSAARDLAMYGVSIDYLSDALSFMDASDEAIDGVFDIYNGLGADEIDLLYDTDWRDDANFLAGLKAKLLKAGFPDDEEGLAMAYDIFEISALADDAMFSFALGDE